MYILSGETKVTITNYVVNRYDNQRGLVLSIYTTKDNISLIDFDTFCVGIKTDHSDILVYNDNDELEQTLRGFYHNCYISVDNNTNTLTAEITNESENTYQIGLLQDKNDLLTTAIIETEKTLNETYNDLTDTQLALVEQYNAKVELEAVITSLQEKIEELEQIVIALQASTNSDI